MANISLQDAFNDSIDRLNRGATIDDCLRAYPQHAAALRPLLETGSTTRAAMPPSAEVIAAQNRSREKLLAALEVPAAPSQRPRVIAFPRLLSRVAAIAAAFMLFFGITGAVAQSALPGDALYGVKRVTEDLRVSLGGGETLRQQFANRRIEEVEALLDAGRTEEVDFRGTIESIDGENWRIAGFDVTVPASLAGANTLRVGDVVRVEAATTPLREIIVTAIRPVDGDAQGIEPTPTATPTVIITETNTPIVTITVTITPTATPTVTPNDTITTPTTDETTPRFAATNTSEPTATPMPTSTNTPRPAATATRTPSPTLTDAACVVDPPEDWDDYELQLGDTLSALAFATGTTVDEIVDVNCIENPSGLIAGTEIYLPFEPDDDEIERPDNSGSGQQNGNQGGSDDDDDDDDSDDDDDDDSDDDDDDDDSDDDDDDDDDDD